MSVTKRLQPKSGSVVADVVEGEAVIINVKSGFYYSTTGVGGWIWNNVAAGVPCDTIRAQLVASGGADAGAAFDAFVAELVAEELVEEADKGAEAVLPGPDGYAPPELVVYRDMQDLMALDPPMPILDDPV